MLPSPPYQFYVYSIVCRCYRNSHNNDNLTDRGILCGLKASAIENFPKFAYTSTNIDVNTATKKRMTDESVVCLERYEENEMLRMLPKCGHVFHVDCIDTWLKCWATYPFCRAILLSCDDNSITNQVSIFVAPC